MTGYAYFDVACLKIALKHENIGSESKSFIALKRETIGN